MPGKAPFMLSAFFAAELLLLAVGLGLVAVSSPCTVPLPRPGRMAFGMAATPFVVGSLFLVTSAVLPGAPVIIFQHLPGLLGGLLIAFNLRTTNAPRCANRAFRRLRDPVVILQLAGVAVVIVLAGCRIGFYLQQPMGNSDALQYLEEARDFATHRSFFEVGGMWGKPDGTLRGDAHGLLWPAYLASALFWEFASGHPASETLIRLPFQASVVLFLPAVIAFASAFRTKHIIFLSVMAALAVPHLFGSSIGGDRDAFRLSALLLLAAFLLAHLRPGIGLGSRPSVLVLSTILSAFAVQGHGLAQILVPVTVAAWFFVAMLARQPLLRAAPICGAAAIGFVIGALHVIGALYWSGSPTGDNVVASQHVHGTVYEQGLLDRDAARIGEGGNLGTRLAITLARDHGWPSVAGISALLFGALCLVKRGKSGLPLDVVEWRPVLLGVWFIGSTLLLLGVFDLGAMKIGAWTVLNPRYAMQWHLAAALLAAWGIGTAISKLGSLRSAIGCTLRVASIAGLSIGTTLIIVKTWPYVQTSAYFVMSQKLNAASYGLPPSCRILSEDTGINFYTERPVVQLYSKPQRDLLHAKDTDTLDKLLADRNLCVVVLYGGLYIDMAGPNSPLAQLLSSGTFERLEALPWRIYIRNSMLTSS